ncbi:hypothetical protein AAC387_Pa03g4667 [Persea americana]
MQNLLLRRSRGIMIDGRWGFCLLADRAEHWLNLLELSCCKNISSYVCHSSSFSPCSCAFCFYSSSAAAVMALHRSLCPIRIRQSRWSS